MTHIMLDLETFGTKPGSVILSIGAVRFNPHAPGEVDSKFHITIDPINAQARGLRLDAETVCWWLDPARRAAWDDYRGTPPFNLDVALHSFSDWLDDADGANPIREPGINRRRVWGNGAAFDNVLLRTAYEVVGAEPPWNHWNDRCFRTLKSLPGAKELEPPRAGTHHNALDDALHQTRWLQEIVRANNLKL